MTEDERVAKINRGAAAHLEHLLAQLDNNKMEEDELLSQLYGGMITAILLGYEPDNMLEEAKLGAEKLMRLIEDSEKELTNNE